MCDLQIHTHHAAVLPAVLPLDVLDPPIRPVHRPAVLHVQGEGVLEDDEQTAAHEAATPPLLQDPRVRPAGRPRDEVLREEQLHQRAHAVADAGPQQGAS